MLDGKIEAKEILFKDLFDSKFLFQIPGYQRPYSWELEQFDQLFEDIRLAMDSGEDHYFLGSVILQTQKQEHDGSGLYDVVDGQQRLTTLTILMAVMRDLAANPKAQDTLHSKIFQEEDEYENTPEEVRLSVRDKDRNFFKKYVLSRGGTVAVLSADTKLLSESQKRIIEAVKTFRKKFAVNDSTDQKLLDSMIKFILNNCIFVYVKTGSFTSAYRLFSVLNDRGMPLTTSDLLKSTNLGAIPQTDREFYQQTWENIEEELGRDELDKLFGHIRTIYTREKARKSIIDEYEQIIFDRDKGLKGKAFIDNLSEVADIYKEHIINANVNAKHVPFYNLMSLMRDFIPNSDWIPAYIAFAQKFSDLQMQYKFLVKLEKLIVVNWLLEVTPTVRILEMNRLISVIDTATDVVQIFNNELFDLTEYNDDVLQSLKLPNFYRKKFCKYILLRLDMYSHDNTNIMKTYTGTISVEHVLPQTPSKDWLAVFTEDERNQWTHRLGNLILLSHAKNASANNRSFADKLTKYYAKGLSDFTLTKQISNYSNWDPSIVEKRHNELISIAEKIWAS